MSSTEDSTRPNFRLKLCIMSESRVFLTVDFPITAERVYGSAKNVTGRRLDFNNLRRPAVCC